MNDLTRRERQLAAIRSDMDYKLILIAYLEAEIRTLQETDAQRRGPV